MKEKDILWAEIQVKINAQISHFHVRAGQIWMCHYGHNVGHEQNGFSRPVLVLKVLNQNLFLTIPLTSSKPPEWCSFDLKDIQSLQKRSYLKVDHIRILDQKRFIRKIGAVSDEILLTIQKKSGAFLLPHGR